MGGEACAWMGALRGLPELEELAPHIPVQAWVSRMSRRYKYSPDAPRGDSGRRYIACVVSDDPRVLAGLPCASLTGVDLVVVSSDM